MSDLDFIKKPLESAFPDHGRAQSEKQREKLTEMGMSLRDYFAAEAMYEFLSMFPTEIWNHAFKMGADTYAQQVAQAAYHMADAMLAAREAT